MPDILRTLHGSDELLAASNDDPFIRWECDPALLGTSWCVGRAFAFLRYNEFRGTTYLNLIGPAQDANRLLASLVARGIDERVSGVSMDQALLPVARRHFDLGPGGDWDWMWTTTVPQPQPTEHLLVELDDHADGSELLRLNEIGNPTAESMPGQGVSELWLGVREEGRIVAAGALHRTGADAPILTGIVTHPDARGRGFGAAVIAALTRVALERSEVATLGMYSGNETARRIYHRLGYRTGHSWASRRFATRP